MTWYTASVITTIRFVNDVGQETFPVFEDFYLLQADSRLSALRKANEIGLSLEQLDDNLELNGKPAKRKFLGIRKVRSIVNPPDIQLDTSPPVDGTELSHSYFEIHNSADLMKLAMGQRVTLEYVDDDES